jgi:hypothetical protein
MRRSDWESVETQAKALLDYIEKTSSEALSARSKEIAERGERLRVTGTPIAPETQALLAEILTPPVGTPWGETVAKVAKLDAAIVEAENAFSAKLRGQATAIVSWSDEPEATRSEIEQKFRAALDPIHRGQVPEALQALNHAIRTSLPKAVARRDAARQAGGALAGVARDLGLPSTDLESALTRDSDAAPFDWVDTVTVIERESQRVADSLRDRVLQTVESLRATLASIKEMELDPEENLAKLREITAQVPAAGPAELPALLESARSLVEEPVVAIVAGLLDEVRPKLVEARRLGRDPSEVFAAMNRAREALRLRIYSEALAASQEALERVGQLTADLDSVRAEAVSLQGLLDRLTAAGFSATPYREPLARALQLLDRVELEPARTLLNDAVRRLGEEAVQHFNGELDELTRIADLAKERGFLPEAVPDQIQKARRLLEDGEITDAGELVSQVEVTLRTAAGPFVARRVEEIERGFEEFPEKSLVAPVRLLLADADVHLRVKEDLAASLESLRKAEREFAAVFAAHASALVEGLEEERRTLEAMGGAGDELQRQIDEVQQIFNMGDFVKASKASQEIRTRAHQQMLLRSEEAVSHAKLATVELGKMGLEVPKIRASFDEAQALARVHKYAEGYQAANAVEHAASRLRGEAQVVLNELQAAQDLWQSLKQSGIAVDGYRDSITKARQLYQSLEFEPARATLTELTRQLERDRTAAETGRLLSEIDQLAQDARRLTLPIEELTDRWSDLTRRAQGGEAADLKPQAEALHVELVRLLRPVLEEHLKAIEGDLEVAQSAGIEVPKVVEMLGDARRRLAAPVPAGVAERLDAARAELVETRGFLEHAQRVSQRARDALVVAQLAHADTTPFTHRLDQLDGLLSAREYAKSIEQASALEREIAQATYHHVSKTLAGFQGMVVRARQDGSDTTLAENLLRQARTALEDGKPLDGLQLAGRSEAELERVELQLRVGQGSLKAIDDRLGAARKDGILSAPAAEAVAKARAAFEAKRYDAVLELSIEAADLLALAEAAHRRAREALDSAERQLQEAERFGADSAEAIPVLQVARTRFTEGAYALATERAREASEKARWSIERVYASAIAEVHAFLEIGRKAGLNAELDPIIGPLDGAESALKVRDWAKATSMLEKARQAAYLAMDGAVAARFDRIQPLYEDPTPASEGERALREKARAEVEAERARHAYEPAMALLGEELARATERRRQELAGRLGELKDQIWIGEKLGVDTTPVMELLSEAKRSIETGKFPGVPEQIAAARSTLNGIVGPRLADRWKELQTEVVFAQEGLHVILGPVPERLQEVDRLRSAGDALAAARLFLAQEEELNQRKSMHRELLNVTYLIDAGLSKASEARLDVAEARKLLDESIRLRATDYAQALAKARESLASIQSVLKAVEPTPVTPAWPFRRSPGEP